MTSFFQALAMLIAAYLLPFDIIGDENISAYDKARMSLDAWIASQSSVDREALMCGVYLFPLPVIMLDEPIHTDAHPFCSDALCPCHLDTEWFQEFIETPRRAGLLTAYEAMRTFYRCHI